MKKSAPGLKAKEIRNGESAFRPKFEHHIPKVASVPRLKPERKDPENREPIRKQIEEEKSKSWYAEGERKKEFLQHYYLKKRKSWSASWRKTIVCSTVIEIQMLRKRLNLMLKKNLEAGYRSGSGA